jgi:hypothetical protein
VIGTVLPACAGAPKNGREYQHRQKKKNTSNFEPDLTAHSSERLEKTSEAAGDSASGLRRLARTGGGICGAGGWLAGGAMAGLAGHALAGDAPCNAQSDAQYLADGFRFHFDMMVAAADALRRGASKSGSQLPDVCLRSKVLEITWRFLRCFGRWPLPEVNL